MKTFYTVRDIEDMHAAGTTEIQLHDDLVLTDVAREKAIALGMRLTPAATAPSRRERPGTATGNPPTAPPPAKGGSTPPAVQPTAPLATDDAAAKIKAAVVARLGTHQYDDVLDRIIPQVMAKLGK